MAMGKFHAICPVWISKRNVNGLRLIIFTKRMTKQFYKDAFVWGFVLWFIGYIFGIILYSVVPPDAIGWLIMPIGIIITLWVLYKKIKGDSYKYYLSLAIVWTLIAVIFDYVFLVQMFKPADGYYKLDVYLYYIMTFILPVLAGLKKK